MLWEETLTPAFTGKWLVAALPPLTLFSLPAESASGPAPLHRSQSLPHAATMALGSTSDPGTLSSSALSEREASRLDKFKQLLAGPNTDLGKSCFRARWFSEDPIRPWHHCPYSVTHLVCTW